MPTIPRHLTDPLIAYLRATSDAPPALLITADGVRRVDLTPLCARCQTAHTGVCPREGHPGTQHPRRTTE